ncbi:MAG: DUF1059 domain-containing protein [Thermoplasmatota archaeon]
MAKIRCADLGADCPFESKGADKKVVKEEFLKHANDHHSDMLEVMGEEERDGMLKKINDIMGQD